MEKAYKFLLENGRIYEGLQSGLISNNLDSILTENHTHYIQKTNWAFAGKTEIKHIKVLCIQIEERECYDNEDKKSALQRNVNNYFIEKLSKLYIDTLANNKILAADIQYFNSSMS